MMTTRRATWPAAAFTLWLAAAGGNAAWADEELLDTLLSNEAITEAQHAALSQREERAESEATVSLDDEGLQITSGDGDFSINIGARLHADWVRHGDEGADADGVDGTNVRRARIELEGDLYADWSWVAEVDFGNSETSIKDFRVSYEGFDGFALSAGHQKQPYNLALEMSSNDMPFVERSVDNELISPFVERAIGARMDTSGEHWFAAAGIFGESVDPVLEGDEGWGSAGRFVYSPIIEDDRVVHLGMRAAYREPASAGGEVRLRAETTEFSELHIVDTGVIADVDGVTLIGPEAALAFGPFTLFSEFNHASFQRDSGEDLEFESWHVSAVWAFGGTSRAQAYEIEAGEFKRLSARRDFQRGDGGGAWELAARLASIDLNDDAIVGGTEKTLTLAANWYANSNVRLMIDWTRVVDTDESNAVRLAADGLDIVAMRAQYAF